MALPPGYLYNYNGGNTALLAAMLAKKTGQTLDAYAREKLFAPLGITNSEWIVMPASNTAAAASGARLRPRDLPRSATSCQDGAWKGKQVLPRGWVAESTRLANQWRSHLLLRLPVVARPLARQSRGRYAGGRRRQRRPAPLHRAEPRLGRALAMASAFDSMIYLGNSGGARAAPIYVLQPRRERVSLGPQPRRGSSGRHEVFLAARSFMPPNARQLCYT